MNVIKCGGGTKQQKKNNQSTAIAGKGLRKSEKEFTALIQCNVSIGNFDNDQFKASKNLYTCSYVFCLAGFRVKYFLLLSLFVWLSFLVQLLSHLKPNSTHRLGKSVIYCMCMCVLAVCTSYTYTYVNFSTEISTFFLNTQWHLC